jgi:hypothetical protein
MPNISDMPDGPNMQSMFNDLRRGLQRRKIRRSIFIGLGGTGGEVIRRLKHDMYRHGFKLPLFQYCVMDTVVYEEWRGIEQSMQLRNGEEYLYIGNYNPNEVLKNLESWPVIASWWGNRMKTNLVTVDEGAGQMRSVGRMGFFYHFRMIEEQLRHMVQQITDVGNREAALQQGFDVSLSGPIIYLVFSLCGGTGSSLYFDVAYVLRELLRFSDSPPTIVAMAMLPGPFLQSISSIPQQERIQANTYAALTELERLHNMALGLEPKPDGKNLWNVQYSSSFSVESADLPFEYIYLIDDTTSKGEKYTRKRIYEQMSRAMFWLSGPSTGSTFWERAKNLSSKTLAGGARADASGVKRLPIYSSLGVSMVQFEWHVERVQHELENRLIQHIREMKPTNPQLPPYLNTEIALIEEVSGEQSGVNPIPSDRMLIPGGNFSDQAAIDNMLDEFKVKYQAALNNLLTSLMWIRSKNKCRDSTLSFINNAIQSALFVRGPVAVLKELELVHEMLQSLRDKMTKEMQKQQRLKSNYDAEILNVTHAEDQQGALGRILGALASLPGRIYLWERVRRNSNSRSRDMLEKAKRSSVQLYRWYDTCYRVIIYNDIIASILTPIMAMVDEQHKNLSGVERRLEAWYKRNENEDIIAANATRDRLWFEHIRPRLSESEQIEDAISKGKVDVQYTLEKVFKKSFQYWPALNDEVSVLLEHYLKGEVIEIFKFVGGEEHLAQRLLSPELAREQQLFLQGAECLWNFVREANQETIPYLEAINLLGYGIDTRQHKTNNEVEAFLAKLLKREAVQPDLVATDISDEMALLKTQHGLMVSSLRSINDMQHAYQVMNTVRGAPYLHIDYDYQIRVAYKPLASMQVTPQRIILQWKDMANKLDDKKRDLADNIRDVVNVYELKAGTTLTESIDVGETDHPFFDLVDSMRKYIQPLNPTPPVIQALMALADMEEILLAQGWIRIEPSFGERFDPAMHRRVGDEAGTGIKAGRVVRTEIPGYIRRRPNEKQKIREAQVIVSI